MNLAVADVFELITAKELWSVGERGQYLTFWKLLFSPSIPIMGGDFLLDGATFLGLCERHTVTATK